MDSQFSEETVRVSFVVISAHERWSCGRIKNGITRFRKIKNTKGDGRIWFRLGC